MASDSGLVVLNTRRGGSYQHQGGAYAIKRFPWRRFNDHRRPTHVGVEHAIRFAETGLVQPPLVAPDPKVLHSPLMINTTGYQPETRLAGLVDFVAGG